MSCDCPWAQKNNLCKHQIDVLMNIRPNLPLGTIIFTCGSWLGIMVGGIVAWQNIPSPKLTIEPIGDLTSHGPSKASKNLVTHTPWTLLTPLQSVLGEISKVTCVLFDVARKNDYLQSQKKLEFKHIHGKMETMKSWLKHVPPL